MRDSMDKVHVICLLLLLKIFAVAIATDSSQDSKPLDPSHTSSERSGRSWHHPALFGPQMLLPHQQQPIPAASTSQPGDTSTGNNQLLPDSAGSNRNFEDPHDKMPDASEMDYMARQFGYMNNGYMNVQRFDPNYMNYYERQAYPRYPNPQTPRFGPGYRKDKYGHGYGYSCKQGDDCDEVRAANQLAARHPAPPPQHPGGMMTFNNHYPDLPPFPSLPSPYSSLIPPSPPSYGGGMPYGGHFTGHHQPTRFSDPHSSMSSMMPPPRFYHGRYLHDQDQNQHQHAGKSLDAQQNGKGSAKGEGQLS
ncbi:hypothetical protein JTE90_006987 [Oedothorax gibbosus]|uniref:Uncharacterized protein n=1 Tax=Oedothorax gibbosus TaxID=931172 RepID=A0AAV6VBV4_9ARAC|nr:hypothetical protein JTE90_006987 [Oedothorax gibbosus]